MTISRHLFITVVTLTCLLMFASAVLPAPTITTTRFPGAVAGGGGANSTGYPYAVYVQISGWALAVNSQAYVKFYSGSNNEYMYSSTGAWSNATAYAAANQPIVNIDASGNWSGWIYVKHNNSITTGTSLRAAKVGATSTNLTSTPSGSYNPTILDVSLTGNGGWVVRSTSPAVNKGILVYSGGNVVGTYRSEDNGIAEGYTYSSGGFKVAVPAGYVDSIVSINDDDSRDQVFVGPWLVSAGMETDVSTGGTVIGKGSATIAPFLFPGTIPGAVTIKVFGSGTDTLTNVRIAVPTSWTWSQADTGIIVTGSGTPVGTVVNDTILVTNVILPATDSLQVVINSITAPDTTASIAFNVGTGKHPDSVFAIGAQPHLLVYGTPRPISEIKANDTNGVPLLSGRWVTVRGVVTVANEFGSPSYIQDNTGGLAVYGTIFSSSVAAGDEVTATGVVSPFNGLCELGSPYIDQIGSHGNSVTPIVVTCAQVRDDGAHGVELYEGRLVRINAVTVKDTSGNAVSAWTVTGSGTNYRLYDAGGYVDVRVDNNVNFANTPTPTSTFDIIGVVSQFKSTSPFNWGYQLMPRSMSDILSKGPIITTVPVESNITPTSFRVDWNTATGGNTRVKYGLTTDYELGIVNGNNLLTTAHNVTLNGLLPATIYHVQVFSVNTDTSFAPDLVVSTASPLTTTGQINVYFNKTVNNTVSSGENALGNQDFVNLLVQRINLAHHTIDLALYSLSGTSQGDAIATALITAKNRGVRIRVICEYDNSSGSFPSLQAAGIPLITDRSDPVLLGAGLMHDKFFVIDGRGDGAPDSIWVITGSWNPTYPGTTADRQNSIHIQDAALAGAYTAEFNQMWGSATDVPNTSLCRFGSRKSDITPHNFVINGIPVQLFFSPSDYTTSHIAKTIGHAQHSVSIGMLTFTRKDLADSVIARHTGGSKTRVVLDNNSDQGNQYAYMQGAGIDIHLKGGSGLLHHKYAVIDGDQFGGNQYLITGSHNWSSAAENSNDENTLIFNSPRIANLYLQEFTARYYEAGGTDSIHVVTSPAYSQSRSTIAFDTLILGQSQIDSFTVTNTGNAQLTVSSITTSDTQFVVTPASLSLAPAAGGKVYVTFTPASIGVKAGTITLVHDASGSPAHVTLTGMGRMPSTDSAAVDMILNPGWNLISVPVAVPDLKKTALFPSIPTPAFMYAGRYYTVDSLFHGYGYWLKATTGDTLSFYGKVRQIDTVICTQGWNMVGTVSMPVMTGTITSTPPGLSLSRFFRYVSGSGYQFSDTLKPGNGYWVKAGAPGTLYIGTLAYAKRSAVRISSDAEMPPAPPDAEIIKPVPTAYGLGQNFPNPWNPSTSITYQLPVDSRVTLTVYNALGQIVAVLVNGVEDAGYKQATLSGQSLSSGVYFYRLEAAGVSDASKSFNSVRKMLLMK